MRILLLSFLIFIACNKKDQLADSPVAEDGQQGESINAAVYRDSLNALPFEYQSNKKGLEIFRAYVEHDMSIDADMALKDFLEFQKKLLDDLNQQLYKRPDFDTINTLTWADTSAHAPAAVKLRYYINQLGLIFSSTEGTVYIDRDVEPIRNTFYRHLSEPVKMFFDQFEMESVEGFAEDGGIYISITDLARRLGFWEEFLQRYPHNIFKEYAVVKVKYYRYYLMAGMDNTPAFDSDSNEMLEEYKEALSYYQKVFANTPSAKIFRAYFEVLSKNNYTFTKAVSDFTVQYQPWD